MSITKVHRYGLRARYQGSQGLTLEAPGKPVLRVANAPEFRSGLEGVWSPEELLTGALAACYERTVVAIAEHKGMPLRDLRVDATGHVQRKDNRYHFMLFELDVEIETDPGHKHEADHIAELATGRCIVESALKVPVHLNVHVRSATKATALA